VRVFLSAAEASGDRLGASLLAALRNQRPNIDSFGMGGDAMAAEGLRLLRHSDEVSVMGFLEVARELPRLFRLMHDLADRGIERNPDIAVLVDAPDFHLRLARRLRAKGIPTVLYVGPSVWAWRPWRVKAFREAFDRILVLFPFELEVWQRAGVDAVCVAHPMADVLTTRAVPKERSGQLVLMPGSRRSEIERHLPLMLRVGMALVRNGQVRSLRVLAASVAKAEGFASVVQWAGASEFSEIVVSESKKREAWAYADLALVASGTATLEVALVGCPQLIVYRMNPVSFRLMRRLAKIPYAGLPNIILGSEVCPERLQDELSESGLFEEAERMLSDPTLSARAVETAEQIRNRLGSGRAAERAAEAVLSVGMR
jgi:lipid-A-disaccharide synthase